jgi:hypothetical protein
MLVSSFEGGGVGVMKTEAEGDLVGGGEEGVQGQRSTCVLGGDNRSHHLLRAGLVWFLSQGGILCRNELAAMKVWLRHAMNLPHNSLNDVCNTTVSIVVQVTVVSSYSTVPFSNSSQQCMLSCRTLA